MLMIHKNDLNGCIMKLRE